ncbi:alkaline phosphatase family protein [Phenylobacterium sp.]|uniref:alkaline phosphatase family protein n=1 Tax=Phenylobacterium sp. TaxID=1871053 RepID=UPI002ED886A6
MGRTLRIFAAALAVALSFHLVAAAAARERNVVLVTLDGMPWQEVFRGADPARAADRAFVSELRELKKDFLDPPDRARALMPFLHEVVAKQGVLLGDRDHGGCMAVTNDQWFSYPGYNELLTGKPDPAIRSNEHGPNRNVTVLEWLNRQPGLKGRVQAFASWEAFRDILNPGRSGVAVNAGWDAAPGTQFARLQAEVPRLWPVERFDAFTHVLALEALKGQSRPRVLYIAYGDTDEFAHEGRYDQMLWAARRSDAFLAELWKTLQAHPAYAGRTTLIVTTDHGRGVGGKDAWRHHGRGAFAQSNETWLAAIGPDVAQGKRPGGECASSSQVAATVASALALDWRAFDPAAARPLDIFR